MKCAIHSSLLYLFTFFESGSHACIKYILRDVDAAIVDLQRNFLEYEWRSTNFPYRSTVALSTSFKRHLILI